MASARSSHSVPSLRRPRLIQKRHRPAARRSATLPNAPPWPSVQVNAARKLVRDLGQAIDTAGVLAYLPGVNGRAGVIATYGFDANGDIRGGRFGIFRVAANGAYIPVG